MYIIRRAFRNYGVMLSAGSRVEPADIKRFKSRCAERDIVEVTESNFEEYQKYFVQRFGVSIPSLVEEANSEPDIIEETPKTIEESKEVAPIAKEKPVEKVVGAVRPNMVVTARVK